MLRWIGVGLCPRGLCRPLDEKHGFPSQTQARAGQGRGTPGASFWGPTPSGGTPQTPSSQTQATRVNLYCLTAERSKNRFYPNKQGSVTHNFVGLGATGDSSARGFHVGALIIRIGLGGPLYYKCNKEPPK